MKNILLLAHDDVGQEARLQCALDLTHGLGGHLTCVDVTQTPVIMADYFSSMGGAAGLVDEQTREAANATRLKARLENEDVAWDWIDASGEISHCVRNHVGLSDAIVINLRLQSEFMPDMHTVASAVVMGVRGVVVAVPENWNRFDVGGLAVVAWDGSPAVMATLQRAIPLLALASSVQLLTVDDGSDGCCAEDAATYLSRHGIHASIRRLHDVIVKADVHIRDTCDEAHAAYCVMGAYGRSRLSEKLFGGVTRRMLDKSKVPIVMGH